MKSQKLMFRIRVITTKKDTEGKWVDNFKSARAVLHEVDEFEKYGEGELIASFVEVEDFAPYEEDEEDAAEPAG